MALIKCKECGGEVSSEAKTCPKCGKRIASRTGCGTLLGFLFLAGIIISVLSSLDSSGTRENASSPPENSLSAIDAQPAFVPESRPAGWQWSYHQSEDSMGKGGIYQAQVLSSNTVEFEFPYAGKQHARLSLRTHPRYGKDLIFSIQKGQILCRSYEDCIVLIRFDDEEAVKYNAGGADDNSTETIFIRNYGKFVDKMLKARRVRIAANIYQEGAPVFEFDVADFDQSKYKPKKQLEKPR